MTECQQDLRAEGKPYPRTCQLCGLGPCKKHPTPDADLITPVVLDVTNYDLVLTMPIGQHVIIRGIECVLEQIPLMRGGMQGMDLPSIYFTTTNSRVDEFNKANVAYSNGISSDLSEPKYPEYIQHVRSDEDTLGAAVWTREKMHGLLVSRRFYIG